MTRATKQERAEAITDLRAQLKPGDVIFTRCNHVSQSGMTRWLDLFVIRDNEPLRLTGPPQPRPITSTATGARA